MRNAVISLSLSLSFSVFIGVVAISSASADDATSAELKSMFQQDQADRLEPEKSQEKRITNIMENDKKRYARLQVLIHEDKLSTGDDYYHAAMLMQHGSTPNDYMLAHILAMAAAQKGNKPAVWLSAASFDRLMLSAGQPQVFGTQQLKDKSGTWTNGKISGELITDSMRKQFNVPTMVESLKRLEEINAKK